MKRIGIIGAGRFGSSLAEYLAEQGAEIVLVERNRDLVQKMSSIATRAVLGDATDVEVLKEAGIRECDIAVVAIGTQIEGSILATMNLKELKLPYIVAKAGTDIHGKVLERIGADLVVYPNKERAQRLARSLIARSALDYFEISDGFSVVELKAPEPFIGKTLIDANIRKMHGVTILAIKRTRGDGKKANIISPTGDETIEEGDSLVIFGPDKRLEKLS